MGETPCPRSKIPWTRPSDHSCWSGAGDSFLGRASKLRHCVEEYFPKRSRGLDQIASSNKIPRADQEKLMTAPKRASGSLWDFTGLSMEGPLAGKQLPRAGCLKDFDWKLYHPATAVFVDRP